MCVLAHLAGRGEEYVPVHLVFPSLFQVSTEHLSCTGTESLRIPGKLALCRQSGIGVRRRHSGAIEGGPERLQDCGGDSTQGHNPLALAQ